jgi:hypothetical protein
MRTGGNAAAGVPGAAGVAAAIGAAAGADAVTGAGATLAGGLPTSPFSDDWQPANKIGAVTKTNGANAWRIKCIVFLILVGRLRFVDIGAIFYYLHQGA